MAKRRGCVISPVDGDQPALAIGLISWAETVGLEILAAGKSSEYDFVFDPAAETMTSNGRRIEVPGFGDMRRLTRCGRLVGDFCSSGQCFAFGFLQIPPRGGHPCRSASGSPCRAHGGLTPPSRPGRPPRRAGTAPIYGASRHAWRTQKKPRPAGRVSTQGIIPRRYYRPLFTKQKAELID